MTPAERAADAVADLLATASDDALREFAYRLVPLVVPYVVPCVVEQLPDVAHDEDRWMDAGEAARYLGMTRNALHKHTAARTIPFVQENGPGSKLWFKRLELDRWRERAR